MLTAEQVDEFDKAGIIRLPGAVPSDQTAAMRNRVWTMLERKHQILRDDRSTWRGQRVAGTRDLGKSETFEEVASPQVCAAIDDLLGAGKWIRPQNWASLLISLPNPDDENDRIYHAWHLDAPAAATQELEFYGLRIFVCLARLAPAGGGTMFVAGSHRLARNIAKRAGAAQLHSHDARKVMAQEYPWLKALQTRGADRSQFMQGGVEIDGITMRVVEMIGEPGDATIVHPLMLHASSKNCSDEPRMVLTSFIHRAP